METDAMEAAVNALLVTDEADEAPTPEAEADDLPSDEAASGEAEEAPADDAEADDVEASDDDYDEPASSDDGADLHDYTVNGQVRKATLAELKQKAALADGAHARMQRAGEAEKAAQATAATFQREFQALQAFHAQARAQGFVPPPQPPNPQLAQQNPAAYVKALADYQGRAQAYQHQQAQLQAAQATFQRAQRAQMEARVAEEAQRLAEFIPDFAKPETAAKARDRLVRAGQDYGFTAQELDGVMDARMVRVLHDAARFRDLEARQREARKPTPTPRHVAPAAAKRPEPPHLAQARQVKQAIAKGPIRAADAASLLLVPQPRKR